MDRDKKKNIKNKEVTIYYTHPGGRKGGRTTTTEKNSQKVQEKLQKNGYIIIGTT